MIPIGAIILLIGIFVTMVIATFTDAGMLSKKVSYNY